jgi:hypothetical protein
MAMLLFHVKMKCKCVKVALEALLTLKFQGHVIRHLIVIFVLSAQNECF